MNKITTWLNRQIGSLILSTAKVEQNALGQESITLGVDSEKHQRLNQNSVLDALIRGEITEDVEKLRWRIYKTTEALKQRSSTLVGYDEYGYPILETKYIGDTDKLSKIKTDKTDNYPLIMVVDNTNISSGVIDSLNLDIELKEEKLSENSNVIDEQNLKLDDEVNNQSDISLNLNMIKTIGELKYNQSKLNLPITIIRELRPKFELEKYTEKLHIKYINNNNYLLEFYVSKYPAQYDKNNHFFISEIKKLINNKIYSSLTDIKSVCFLTNNTIGSPDFLEYEYDIINFDKIVEFNQYYVIKFISEVKINGKNIIEKFKNVELDEKYNKKEKRN